jgi:hypothetical protein
MGLAISVNPPFILEAKFREGEREISRMPVGLALARGRICGK